MNHKNWKPENSKQHLKTKSLDLSELRKLSNRKIVEEEFLGDEVTLELKELNCKYLVFIAKKEVKWIRGTSLPKPEPSPWHHPHRRCPITAQEASRHLPLPYSEF